MKHLISEALKYLLSEKKFILENSEILYSLENRGKAMLEVVQN